MGTPLTILGINGSLRNGSFNRMALVEAQKLTPADARINIYDLHEIPLFNQDQEATPPVPVADFKKLIRTADAILFATPEYNYSVPGVLKNAIDWASRPLGENAWRGQAGRCDQRSSQPVWRCTGAISSAANVRMPGHACGESAGSHDRAGSGEVRRKWESE